MVVGLRRGMVALVLTFVAAAPAVAQADTLDVVGQSNLGGAGLNGQVATVGNIAVVGSGVLGGAGVRSAYYSTYPCPASTVKIVDVSTPSAPVIRSQIPIEQHAVANDVAALRVNTPSFNGVLLAVALVRCSNTAEGNATERGVAYYDITNPSNPIFKGRFNPDENAFLASDPPCSLAVSTRCASSNDNVSLVQRPDGKVLSLSTEPFSSNSQPNNVRAGCGPVGSPTACPWRGDVRIVDVTNPSAPTFAGSYPNAAQLNNGVEQRPPGYAPPGGAQQPVSTSNNGCRNFNAALGVGVQNSTRALVPYFDAGLLVTDITNPAAPTTLGQWAYPTTRALEGNAAYVDPARVGGRDLALVGETDWVGPQSSLRINGSGPLAGSKFACEASFTLFDPENTAQVYRKPGSQIPGDIVYVGRACPGDPIVAAANISGKIAFRDRNRIPDREPAAGTNCTVQASVKLLQDRGALGVVMGNTATNAPQAVTLDGDPVFGGDELRIPVTMIDTGDAVALRDALCPIVAGGAGGCGPGGQSLSGAMVDSPGEWGALRVIDVTNPTAPTLRGTYRPPGGRVFPPPDLGVYSVHHAVARGSTAFVAGHSNGLRAIDLRSANPTELAAFVPPDRPDPTNSIPDEANVVGVDVAANNSIVVSDINAGLYVLRLRPATSGPGPVASAFPECPASTSRVVRGTAAGESINGTAAADRIFAAAGNDVVDGLAGNDCIDLGDGTDRGQGGDGVDLLLGGLGADRLSGNLGNDRLRGGSSRDRLIGGFGSDRLFGESGSDRMLGERGADRLSGGSGGDVISAGSSGDRVAGGPGGDRINGNSGRDSLSGNSGNDRISARDGQRDRVNCGSGRDRVVADRIDRVAGNCERIRRRR